VAALLRTSNYFPEFEQPAIELFRQCVVIIISNMEKITEPFGEEVLRRPKREDVKQVKESDRMAYEVIVNLLVEATVLHHGTCCVSIKLPILPVSSLGQQLYASLVLYLIIL
jgi:hypothetical protein